VTRVCVTGGRDYADAARVFAELDRIDAARPIACVIHGACRVDGDDHVETWHRISGADRWADEWAIGWTSIDAYPVRRSVDGGWPAAGQCRNARMLRDGRPDLVLAFPGGRGTRGCVKQARALGIRVIEVAP
jgi:hypothetical protein